MQVGRPSDYTKWKARAICMRLAMGQSLRRICQHKLYPSRYAVLRWLQVNEEFRNQYAQAREMQAEYYLDDIIDIADDSSLDTYETEDGQERVNHENIQRARLRVDTRKWAMEKMSAKKYGASQKIEHAGTINNVNYSPEDYKKAQDKLKSELDDLD